MTARTLVRRARQSPNWDVGLSWYQDVSAQLEDVAHHHGTDHVTACAIASQLSPMVRWETALRDCYDPENAATFGLFRQRALACLLEGPDRADWGPKTFAFWRNLAYPTRDTAQVTLDRHHARLHRIPKWTPKRYETAAEEYRRAARTLGILPHQLQAIIWLDIRP